MHEWGEGTHDYFIIMELPDSAVDLFDLIQEKEKISERCAKHIFGKVSNVNLMVQNQLKIFFCSPCCFEAYNVFFKDFEPEQCNNIRTSR